MRRAHWQTRILSLSRETQEEEQNNNSSPPRQTSSDIVNCWKYNQL